MNFGMSLGRMIPKRFHVTMGAFIFMLLVGIGLGATRTTKYVYEDTPEEIAISLENFKPLGPTPFTHVKEWVIQKKVTSPIKDSVVYNRMRTEVGLSIQKFVETERQKPQIEALFEAAEKLGNPLPKGFLYYKWGSSAPPAPTKRSTGAEPKTDMEDVTCRNYIEKYSSVAVSEQKKFNIPASILLAQGLVESGAGTSKLSRGNNNHFGIKCFSKRCPKGHCTNMTDDHHKDFFRKYSSAWQSWREHSQLLAGSHYGRLKKYGRDYKKWAYGLKALGYATDRTYAEKLIGMIEKYDLQRFDK